MSQAAPVRLRLPYLHSPPAFLISIYTFHHLHLISSSKPATKRQDLGFYRNGHNLSSGNMDQPSVVRAISPEPIIFSNQPSKMDNRIIRNDDRHRTTALPASSKPQLSYHAGSTNVSGPGRFLCLDARKKWITFGSPLPLYTSPLMTLIIFTTLQKRTSNNPEVPLYTSLRTTILNKIWYKTNLGRTTDYNTIVSNSQAIRYVE